MMKELARIQAHAEIMTSDLKQGAGQATKAYRMDVEAEKKRILAERKKQRKLA